MKGISVLILVFSISEVIHSGAASRDNSATCSARAKRGKVPEFKSGADLQKFIEEQINIELADPNRDGVIKLEFIFNAKEKNPAPATVPMFAATTSPLDDTTTSADTSTANTKCSFARNVKAGCEINPSTRFWIEFPTKKVNFSQATEICLKKNGTVATTLNGSVYEAIKKKIRGSGFNCPSFWFGASIHIQNCTVTPPCAQSWTDHRFPSLTQDYRMDRIIIKFCGDGSAYRVHNVLPSLTAHRVVCQGDRNCSGLLC